MGYCESGDGEAIVRSLGGSCESCREVSCGSCCGGSCERRRKKRMQKERLVLQHHMHFV